MRVFGIPDLVRRPLVVELPKPARPLMRALEQRILLDAAMVETAADLIGHTVHSQLADDHAAGLSSFTSEPEASLQEPQRNELIIVTLPVEETGDLLRHFHPGVEVIVLDPAVDPFAQMRHLMSQRPLLDAVHIIAHGSDGELSFGTATLNAQTMAGQYAEDLTGWRSELSADADLLIYGCDFGAGATGAAATSQLAQLTGADVASSTDRTGHASRGGDWDLERRVGEIESSSLAESNDLSGWMGALPDTVVESNEPPIGVLKDDLDIQSDKNQAQTFRHNTGSTYSIDTVELVLYRKADAIPQTIIVTIRDSFDGAVLATATLASSELDTAYSWERFTLDNRITLNSGTEYVVQVSTDTTAGKLRIGQEDADNYANGTRIKDNGDVVPNQDLAFRIIDSVSNTPPVLNTPPAQAAPIPATTVQEDGSLGFNNGNGNAITVSDADGDNMSLIVSVDAGTLTVSSALGATISGTGSDTITISGPAFSIDQVLQSLEFFPVADANSDVGAGGSDITMSLSLDDGKGEANSVTIDTVMIGITPVADITDDAVVTARDTPVTFNAITGTNGATADSFENGSAVVASVTQGANGAVSFNPAGDLTYTPNGGFGGSDSFTYTVQTPDGKGGFIFETATVSVTVSTPNSAPVITSNGGGATAAVNVDENQTAVTTVVANDTDLPADTLVYTISGGADGGLFSLNPSTGALTFTNAPDFETPNDGNGDNIYEVEVQVDDQNGGTDTQFISVTVNDIADTNTAPVITSNGGGAVASLNIDEEQTTVTTITAVDSDIPADTLTYTIAGGADAALFTVDPMSGDLTFISPPDFENPVDANGDNIYEVDVRVDDGEGGADTQAMLVTIDDVNVAPVALGNHLITTENAPLALDAGDFRYDDTEGQALQSVTITNLALNGGTLSHSGGAVTVTGGMTVTAAQLADLTFTPAPNSTADATFSYTVNDDDNGTVQATFRIGFDAAGDRLREVFEPDFNQLDDIQFELRSDQDWAQTFSHSAAGPYGVDSIDLVLYRELSTPLQTISVSIRSSHDGPILASGTITSVSLDTDLRWHTIALDTPVVLNSATTYVLQVETNSTSGQVFVGIDEGSAYGTGEALLNGASKVPAGDLAFRLVDENATPVITSNLGGPTATINSDENRIAINPVTASDADTPSDTLVYSIAGGADASAFTIDSATGAISFVTAPDFEAPTDSDLDGTYEVTVQVDDGRGGSDTQAISVFVNDVSEGLTTPEDTPLPISFADGMGGTWQSITFSGLNLDGGTLSHSGGAVIVVDGMTVTEPELSTLVFTPAPNAFGSVSFNYAINDAAAGGASGIINIDVLPVNDLPVATGNTVNTNEDTAYVFVPADFTFTDVEGDALQSITVSALNLAGGTLTHTAGTVTVTNGMTITLAELADLTFTPAPDSDAIAAFAYRVNDADNGTMVSTMSIMVDAVNDAPVVTPIADQTNVDSATISLDVSVNFSDVEGDALSFIATGLPTGLSINAATGLISGTVDSSASQGAPYIVTVTASDGNGGTVSDTFGWDISNPAPTAVNDVFSVVRDGTLSNSVATNDSDPDGDSLTYAIIGNASNGMVMLNAAGSFIYNPDPGFTGSDGFVYSVTDADGSVQLASVTIAVTAVNDAPTVAPLTDIAGLDAQTVSLDISGEFTDANGDALTFTASGLPAGLTVGAASGIISGVIDSSASQASPYIVTITANDGNGGTVSGTFNWTVTNPAPIAGNDGFTAVEDNPFAASVAGNDSDSDGDTLVYSMTTGPSSGGIAFNPDGSFIYTPYLDFNGTDGFSYIVDDSQGGITTASVSLNVTAVNDLPVATGNSITAEAGEVVLLGLNGFAFTDVEGDALQSITITGLNLAGGQLTHSGGTVVVTDGMTVSAAELADLTFSPATGAATAATFQYTVNDGDFGTTTASISIDSTTVTNPVVEPIDPATPAAPEPDVTSEIQPPDTETDLPETLLETGPETRPGTLNGPASPPTGSAPQLQPPPVIPVPVVTDSAEPEPPVPVAISVVPPPAAPAPAETAPAIKVEESEEEILVELPSIPGLGLANLSRSAMLNEMDRARSDLQQHEDAAGATATEILLAFGTVLSVGTVAWTLRTGSLAAAFLATLPAWRGFDPIMIAKRRAGEGEDAVEPTLVDMMFEKVRAAQNTVREG